MDELTKIRDDARDGYGGKPEEAAARAFRDLILQNPRVPIEQRLEASFSKVTLLKVWHFHSKVNVDLHLGIKSVIEDLLCEYVGRDYQNDFYKALSKWGVTTPIEHDTLATIAFVCLYMGKKSSIPADHAAVKLCSDVIAKDLNKYSACITK